MERSAGQGRQASASRAARAARLDRIREIVARGDVENQQQLADLLAASGDKVTQTTISRDIAALGLVKAFVGDRHVYVSSDAVPPRRSDDAMLRRVLRDVPVEVRRSGLILILVSTPGSAAILAEAIDRSGLAGPEGTIAGDNTVLVLFADDPGLARWRADFERIQALATG